MSEVIQATVAWMDLAARMALAIEEERWTDASEAARDYRVLSAYFGPDGQPRSNVVKEAS